MNSEIAVVNAEIGNVNGEIAVVNAEIGNVNGEIAVVNAEIAQRERGDRIADETVT